MTPEGIGFAILLLALLLLGGKLLRLRWRLPQKLFLPSSIIAGLLALLLGPDVLGAAAERLGWDALGHGLWGESAFVVWEALPELLISVVFASLFLGHTIPRPREIWDRGGPQLSVGVTMGAGQYVVGMLLALLVLTPLFGLNPLAGALIEIGFEGGHGTAAGLGETFEGLGFEEGEDLALGLATIGLVAGVLFGVGLINWGARTGRTAFVSGQADQSRDQQRGIFAADERPEGASMTVRPESIEPLSIHCGLVGAAVLVGVALLEGLQALEDTLWAPAGVEIIEHVPLFPLAMIGGLIVQLLIQRFDRRDLVDRRMILRVQGIALDVLIVAALATLSLDVIGAFLAPFLMLAGAGIAWNLIVFLLLVPRMIPTYAFERGLTDFGQSMGVTATGLVLLRVVDPQNESPAMESFGYKQLGFEPVLGGGLVTALSMPLIAQVGPLAFLAIMAVVLAGALTLGLAYFGRQRARTDAEVSA